MPVSWMCIRQSMRLTSHNKCCSPCTHSWFYLYAPEFSFSCQCTQNTDHTRTCTHTHTRTHTHARACRYADRAKEIKTHVVQNVGTVESHIADYQRMIDTLQVCVCASVRV